MDFLTLLDKCKEEVLKLDGIEEDQVSMEGRLYSLKRVAHAEGLAKIEQFIGSKIPENFKSVYAEEISSINLSWQSNISNANEYWHCNGAFYLTPFSMIWDYYSKPRLAGKDPGTEGVIGRRLQILQEEKMFPVGGFAKFEILCKVDKGDHELFIWIPSENSEPIKLSVKLRELIEIMLSLGGIESFPLYLADEFPADLIKFPYDGFFEQVERHFPDVLLSKFNHRDKNQSKTSILEIGQKLSFSSKALGAFSSLPKGAGIHRWHPHWDIPIFPDSYLSVVGWQLEYGIQLSNPMIAFWMMSTRFLMNWSFENDIKANFEFPFIHEVFQKYYAPDHYKISIEDAPNLENKYLFYTDPYNDMLVEFHGEGVCTFHLLYLEADDYTTHFITDDFDWLVNQLFQTRGMFWWNYFLVFTPSASDQRYEKFYQQLIPYFPDADRSRCPDPAELE